MYNPRNIRHPRRTRIINTIKSVCTLHNYTYSKNLHTLFNKYADEHDSDRKFTEMCDALINGYYEYAPLELQVTNWTNYHFNTLLDVGCTQIV